MMFTARVAAATVVTFDNFKLKAWRRVPVPPQLSLSVIGTTRHIAAQRLTPGCQCVLERTTSLAPGAAWETVGTWTAAGTSLLIPDPQAPAGSAFYRLSTQ